MIQQISVFVENETGSISQVTGILKDNSIDIRAIAGFDGPTYSILRLIVDKPSEATEILKKERFSVKMTSVLAVELNDKMGSLNDMLDILKSENISVNYIYSFVLQAHQEPWMIMHLSDMDKAEQILRQKSFCCMP